MAEATKISSRFLAAIENGRIDVLPGGLFPRSFVRQYASYLGLDAERTVVDFLHQLEAKAAPPAGPPPRRLRLRGPVSWLLTLGLLLGPLGVRQISGGRAQPLPPSTMDGRPSPEVQPSDRVFPAQSGA